MVCALGVPRIKSSRNDQGGGDPVNLGEIWFIGVTLDLVGLFSLRWDKGDLTVCRFSQQLDESYLSFTTPMKTDGTCCSL